ncbi:MAG: glycosyltransferase family 4 protein [Syntrophorhabdales bacterium]|jgi:glycosyltransferase involved in cell wall biosynthesis
MGKLKIAYVLPGIDVSGGVAVVLQHTSRLLRRGHDVMIGSMGSISRAGWLSNRSVPILRTADLPDDLDILVATSWATVFEIVKLKARHKCYFVQSDETRFHNQGTDWFHFAHLSYLMNMHFLTEAKWIQEWLLRNFGKQSALIPNGLDQEIFHPATPLEKKTDRPRVLLEGAIALAYKGMKEAFEALKDLDIEIWCVSSYGKPEPGWRCDRFFEKVPIDRMNEIYSSCDILLKLSRVEGFFGPPLEMMACGGVCVVGAVTGHEEYIADGENALVVDPTDIKGARGAVQRLIADRNLREKLRKNGLRTAAQWPWEPSIDRLETYFSEIAAGVYGETNPCREQTNQSIAYFYEKILSLPSSQSIDSLEVLAHRIKRHVSNEFLLKLGEKTYYHMLKHKSLYNRLSKLITK